MKAKLVQVVDDEFLVSTFEADALIGAMELRGFAFTGLNRNPRVRAELQGQPKFAGVLGPMCDGDGTRYEDPEANDRLSC